MIPLLCVSSLTAVPAQATSVHTAVRVVLQIDPPPAGGSPMDPSPVADAMKAFAEKESFAPLAEGGDGWVLGVQIKTQDQGRELVAGGATLKLARVEKGIIQKDSIRQNGVVAEGLSMEALDDALADAILDRARALMERAKIVQAGDAGHSSDHVEVQAVKDPETGAAKLASPELSESAFPKVLSVPPQPSYPGEAKMRQVQGVVTVRLTIDQHGKPISAAALEGPPLLLNYAITWAMKWRFMLPEQNNIKPKPFSLHLNFRLR